MDEGLEDWWEREKKDWTVEEKKNGHRWITWELRQKQTGVISECIQPLTLQQNEKDLCFWHCVKTVSSAGCRNGGITVPAHLYHTINQRYWRVCLLVWGKLLVLFSLSSLPLSARLKWRAFYNGGHCGCDVFSPSLGRELFPVWVRKKDVRSCCWYDFNNQIVFYSRPDVLCLHL